MHLSILGRCSLIGSLAKKGTDVTVSRTNRTFPVHALPRFQIRFSRLWISRLNQAKRYLHPFPPAFPLTRKWNPFANTSSIGPRETKQENKTRRKDRDRNRLRKHGVNMHKNSMIQYDHYTSRQSCVAACQLRGAIALCAFVKTYAKRWSVSVRKIRHRNCSNLRENFANVHFDDRRMIHRLRVFVHRFVERVDAIWIKYNWGKKKKNRHVHAKIVDKQRRAD